MSSAISIYPVSAPVQSEPFPLIETIIEAYAKAEMTFEDGDIIALSSKYTAISEGRIVDLATIQPTEKAHELAARYHMDPTMAELVLQEADHLFGGIPLGFLLTWRNGVISPNAGIDRSNIPHGYAVLLPAKPYESARQIRKALEEHSSKSLGIILTDSWLMPGRWGTTGVSIGSAGFKPVVDERGKMDLFGNPMAVTQVGVADSLCIAAQLVMGERDEACPIAVIRNSGVPITGEEPNSEDVSIPWEMCIYIESLTLGLLPDGAPKQSMSEMLSPKSKPEA